MKYLKYLRTRFSPRPVSAIVAEANAMIYELNLTAEIQADRASEHHTKALLAQAEASRAVRIAGKIKELVS